MREFQRLQTLSRQAMDKQGLFSKMNPRRFFNNNIDRQIENLLSKLPNGNIGVLIVGLNTLLYAMYFFWPTYNLFSFMNNFTFSQNSLRSGAFWSMFLCHFAHLSFFNYFLDSLIIFLLCQNLSMMFGGLYITKTAILSCLLGSAFVFF